MNLPKLGSEAPRNFREAATLDLAFDFEEFGEPINVESWEIFAVEDNLDVLLMALLRPCFTLGFLLSLLGVRVGNAVSATW